jgi:hypothetical protein
MNELDETVFIPSEEYSLKKEWVEKNIKGMEWRDGYIHQRIYNEVSFKLGILDKIEATRQRMSVDSSKEVVKLLHILGYGSKQTAYWLWKWGYKGISLPTIQAYIRINRRHWAKDKEKFMSEIVELKEKLFQSAKEEVMAAERTTMEILLRNIKKLQESLESLDPVKDKAEFNTTYNQLIKLEERCKSYHGLEEFRSASIKASTEIAVYKEKAKVDSNPNPQIKDAIETKAELME